jgi:hypothetical protein
MRIRRDKKKDISARLQSLRQQVKSQRYADYDDSHMGSVDYTSYSRDTTRRSEEGSEEGIVDEDEVALLMGDFHRHHIPPPPELLAKMKKKSKFSRPVAVAGARRSGRDGDRRTPDREYWRDDRYNQLETDNVDRSRRPQRQQYSNEFYDDDSNLRRDQFTSSR